MEPVDRLDLHQALVLALDERSPERLRRLSGRTLQLDIEGLGITLFFAFDERRVRVSTRTGAAANTVIAGSPSALFRMAAPDAAEGWAAEGSRVNITGDAQLARDLERLFSQLDPDWESGLARVFGDVWGHQVAAGIRSGSGRAREAAREAGDRAADALRCSRTDRQALEPGRDGPPGARAGL